MNRHMLGCVTAAALAVSLPTLAHEASIGDLTVIHPWIAEAPPGAPTAAGFGVIVNDGETEDRLVGASAAFADEVQIHEMVMDGDVMQMRELEGGLPVPAGDSAVLEPGGYHLMFVGVTDRPEEGDMLEVKLIFQHAGEVDVEFMVQKREDGEMDSHDHTGTESTE